MPKKIFRKSVSVFGQRENEHQDSDCRWARMGVDELQLKTTQIYDFENGLT